MAKECKGVVTMKGAPVTVVGPDLSVGDKAPDFTAVDGDLHEVSLSDFAGRIVVISSVVSVDTSVCAVQTKRFSDEAQKLPDDVVVLTVSADLPFALGRFCSAEEAGETVALSDHRQMSFGEAYGVLIKGLRLLARSVWVVDRDGRIVYKEIVPEVTDHPAYERALDAARKAAG
jgi:thiol peroxidase